MPFLRKVSDTSPVSKTSLLIICSLYVYMTNWNPWIGFPPFVRVSDTAPRDHLLSVCSLYFSPSLVETLELVCLLSGRFLILHLVSNTALLSICSLYLYFTNRNPWIGLPAFRKVSDTPPGEQYRAIEHVLPLPLHHQSKPSPRGLF